MREFFIYFHGGRDDVDSAREGPSSGLLALLLLPCTEVALQGTESNAGRALLRMSNGKPSPPAPGLLLQGPREEDIGRRVSHSLAAHREVFLLKGRSVILQYINMQKFCTLLPLCNLLPLKCREDL